MRKRVDFHILGDDKAQEPTLIQAKAIAMTALDLYLNPNLIKIAKGELEKATIA